MAPNVTPTMRLNLQALEAALHSAFGNTLSPPYTSARSLKENSQWGLPYVVDYPFSQFFVPVWLSSARLIMQVSLLPPLYRLFHFHSGAT